MDSFPMQPFSAPIGNEWVKWMPSKYDFKGKKLFQLGKIPQTH